MPTKAETALPQNWTEMQPGQPVLVTQPGRQPCVGHMDTMTEEHLVLWILLTMAARAEPSTTGKASWFLRSDLHCQLPSMK